MLSRTCTKYVINSVEQCILLFQHRFPLQQLQDKPWNKRIPDLKKKLPDSKILSLEGPPPGL